MAWTTVSDGVNNYRLFLQEKDNSCGVACTLMVVKLLQGKELPGSTVRRYFGEVEGAVNVRFDGIRDFDDTGSDRGAVVSTLAHHFKIPARRVASNYIKKYLEKVNLKKPGIMGVGWGTGNQWQGGHWVLAIHYNAYRMLCLDPVYGLVESNSALYPFYINPNQPEVRGKICDYVQIG